MSSKSMSSSSVPTRMTIFILRFGLGTDLAGSFGFGAAIAWPQFPTPADASFSIDAMNRSMKSSRSRRRLFFGSTDEPNSI